MTGRGSGRQAQWYPLDARLMARTCRKLAADLRTEAALGYGPIGLTASSGWTADNTISRWEAAWSLDLQAERWEDEVATGRPNVVDRRKIGW